MKTIFKLITMILIVATSLSSCQKIADKWWPGSPHKKECRIRKITQSNLPIGGKTRTGIFYYSSGRRLDSLSFDLHTGTGVAQFHYWKYDNQNRLIGYRSDYSRNSGDYYWLHRYVWQGGKIVRDSIWLRGAGLDTIVIDIQYDNEGRVNVETRRQIFPMQHIPDGPSETTIYQYNTDGNLIKSFPYGYDQEKNYLSTDRVLQFIHRDFSKNNPVGATGYNNASLPLGFGRSYAGFAGFFDWGHPETIEYDCPK